MLPNPSTSSCEKVVGCSQKNRHTVWPIRETRVRLSTSYTPPCNSTSEDICESYINANYIVVSFCFSRTEVNLNFRINLT